MIDTITSFEERAEALMTAYQKGEKATRIWVRQLARPVADAPLLQDEARSIVAAEGGYPSWQALLDADELDRQIGLTMACHPQLTSFGIGVYFSVPREDRPKQMASGRQALRQAGPDIAWTIQWLADNIAPIKSINRMHDSYGLKHLAEKSSPRRYLTNGSFIAAGIISGYPYEFPSSSPNVLFGMSERSIKRVVRLLNEMRFAPRTA